jgi:SAM-dependent methyltransferase
MRWEVVERFRVEVLPLLNQRPLVALVGGGTTDPEVVLLAATSDPTVTYFGVEAEPGLDFQWLDLNEESGDVSGAFDVVVCSQVLEHVWHLQNALGNLAGLAKPGGLIWVNVPSSNFVHGYPNYYAAGYSPEMLVAWGRHLGLEVIYSEAFGSQRYYTWIHRYHFWPDESQMRHPLRFRLRGSGSLVRRAGREAKRLGRLLALGRTNNSVEGKLTWATETVVLFRRPQVARIRDISPARPTR